MQNRETNKVTDKNKVRARKNETLYIVSTESMQGARESAYEILERLVMKKFTSLTEERLGDGKLRTCCYYIDDGYSGTNFNRPDFQRMMSDVDEGKVKTIIVKDYCAIIGLNQKDLENQGILA